MTDAYTRELSQAVVHDQLFISRLFRANFVVSHVSLPHPATLIIYSIALPSIGINPRGANIKARLNCKIALAYLNFFFFRSRTILQKGSFYCIFYVFYYIDAIIYLFRIHYRSRFVQRNLYLFFCSSK